MGQLRADERNFRARLGLRIGDPAGDLLLSEGLWSLFPMRSGEYRTCGKCSRIARMTPRDMSGRVTFAVQKWTSKALRRPSFLRWALVLPVLGEVVRAAIRHLTRSSDNRDWSRVNDLEQI